jgi:hypothetical protein
MSKPLVRIPIGELVENPNRVLERVARERKSVVVEKQGKLLVMLTPIYPRSTSRRKTPRADHRAFLDAAGSWKDMDTDKFIADVYTSRKHSARPAVEL